MDHRHEPSYADAMVKSREDAMSANETRPASPVLNIDCGCVTLDRAQLDHALSSAIGDTGFAREVAENHPHLVSDRPVFVSAAEIAAIERAVGAIELACRLPGFVADTEQRAPPVARQMTGPIGVFMGYDFHLSGHGPRLIEINTNAGGALINAYLREAHRTCCQPVRISSGWPSSLTEAIDAFLAAFHNEWMHFGAPRRLASIAIVDEAPEQQYLYPEFQLFARLFESHGMSATIAGPEELAIRDGRLYVGDLQIDLVYNRLTDFYFEAANSAVLRGAYLERVAAVTPNPWAHARFADKRNLILLSNPGALSAMGLPDPQAAVLAAVVPKTLQVTREHAGDLWLGRKRLFFKPHGGHGGKAAYRGDKLTRTVFDTIISSGNYVAQEIVAPGKRTVVVDGTPLQLKSDIRAYAYNGKIQLLAARLYQGQTTNFRTPGGGFAPAFVVDDPAATCGCSRN